MSKSRELKKIVIATANAHKLAEIKEILKPLPVELLSLKDFPEIPPIEETGTTFEENALLKARPVFEHCGLLTLADDSGLEVDVLNGQPGILSARYAPFPDATDADHRRFLLQELKDKEQPWEAKFHCAIAMITPDGLLHLFEGNCPGQILPHERGENGFGYDPIFLLPDRDQTMAELTNEEKNNISHRGQAMHDAITVIQAVLNE